MVERLAGGVAMARQRVRLAAQLGSTLTGVTYILDEPTIGLHPRDNAMLVGALCELRHKGNSILVVEHDEATIRAADTIIDLGPGAGQGGGEIVAMGGLEDLRAANRSVTGALMEEGARELTSKKRGHRKAPSLLVRNASVNNLKQVEARFPLGRLVAVTGVSGSGKSTLVNEILLKAALREVQGSKATPGAHEEIHGLEQLERIVEVDQSPIGRTPRSNPATYTGILDEIRKLLALVPEAKIRGYQPGRFSFNVKGGRCETCQGQGVRRIEMHFLPDVFVTCETCKGRRFNRETLEVRFKGKSISDILDLTVEDATEFFSAHPKVARMLACLRDVGLGYVQLGQASTTLSGGEAQRVKLASELGLAKSGPTLYVLDEPTTGLHFDDVRKLIEVLERLAESGHSLVVIEHNLDVVKRADWIVDLGPEGGDRGGTVLAVGTPEEVAANPASHTGRFLKPLLDAARVAEATPRSTEVAPRPGRSRSRGSSGGTASATRQAMAAKKASRKDGSKRKATPATETASSRKTPAKKATAPKTVKKTPKRKTVTKSVKKALKKKATRTTASTRPSSRKSVGGKASRKKVASTGRA